MVQWRQGGWWEMQAVQPLACPRGAQPASPRPCTRADRAVAACALPHARARPKGPRPARPRRPPHLAAGCRLLVLTDGALLFWQRALGLNLPPVDRVLHADHLRNKAGAGKELVSWAARRGCEGALARGQRGGCRCRRTARRAAAWLAGQPRTSQEQHMQPRQGFAVGARNPAPHLVGDDGVCKDDKPKAAGPPRVLVVRHKRLLHRAIVLKVGPQLLVCARGTRREGGGRVEGGLGRAKGRSSVRLGGGRAVPGRAPRPGAAGPPPGKQHGAACPRCGCCGRTAARPQRARKRRCAA